MLDYSAYEGLTVRQFCDQMNVALGMGVAAYSFDELYYLTETVAPNAERFSALKQGFAAG